MLILSSLKANDVQKTEPKKTSEKIWKARRYLEQTKVISKRTQSLYGILVHSMSATHIAKSTKN